MYEQKKVKVQGNEILNLGDIQAKFKILHTGMRPCCIRSLMAEAKSFLTAVVSFSLH